MNYVDTMWAREFYEHEWTIWSEQNKKKPESLVEKSPLSSYRKIEKKFIMKFVGSKLFINNKWEEFHS